MAKQKKNKAGNRRKKGGGKPFLMLILTVLFIAGAFFLLEKVKGRQSVKPVEKPPVVERHKMPPRVEEQAVAQQPYTTVATVPPAKHAKKKRTVGPGTVAIIIDDMGSSVNEARELMAIPVPLTFSLIPGLAHVKDVAEAAHRRGFQVMVHMPMEPKGYPQQKMEKNGLLLNQDDEEISRRVEGYFQSVPYAVGANNHMGSHFTENEGKMRTVMGVLKDKGIFYVDSRTSPKSVGYSLARAMGLETSTRNVFLDNEQDVAAIRAQLAQLAAIARKRGSAIGICHPHKPTIQALASELPVLQREGITFVHASELVR